MKKIKLILLTLLSFLTFNGFSQGTVLTVNVVNQVFCQYNLSGQYWNLDDSLSVPQQLIFNQDTNQFGVFSALVESNNFSFIACVDYVLPCEYQPECVESVVVVDDTVSNSFSVTILLDGLTDYDGDGYTSDVDCDDNNHYINPGMIEICDAFDNNCDGLIMTNTLELNTEIQVASDSTNPQLVYIVFTTPDTTSGVFWSVNSSPVDSSNAYPQFTLTGAGQYNICVSLMNSECYYDTCVTITVDTSGNWSSGFVVPQVEVIVVPELPLSTNSEILDAKLYPNPVVDELNIISSRNLNRVEVYNVSGFKVAFTTFSKTTKLDLSGLSSGIYYVKIFDNFNNHRNYTIIK
jgi:hypothetical protein